MDILVKQARDMALHDIRRQNQKQNESVNFERGKDPQETMGIGKYAKIEAGDIVKVWFDGVEDFDLPSGWKRVEALNNEEEYDWYDEENGEYHGRWFDGKILEHPRSGTWYVNYDENMGRWIIQNN
jgi:hypothetical protein